MTVEEIRLSQITDRLNATTQGDWVAHTWDPMERPHVVVVKPGTGERCCSGRYDLPLTKEDAEFIAASPADVGFLLTYIDRLNAELTKGG